MIRRRRLSLVAAALSVALAGCAGTAKGPEPTASTPSATHTQLSTTAKNDPFGIRLLHPTSPDGLEWVSKWNQPRSFDGVDPQDPWFDADHGSASYQVKDGQLFISGDIPRMYIHDPAMRQQWRDVEITMYFKRVDDSSVPYAGMTAVARSNHLDTESGTAECDTRGIGARIRYDGHVDFEKETAFPLNVAIQNKKYFSQGMPENEWIGYKYLVFDRSDGVHMQLWVDRTNGKNGGDWQLLNQVVDDGNLFGKVPCAPGINPKMALTNDSTRKGSESGKPNISVYFRSDGVSDEGLVYKWGSVREIQP